MFIEDLKKLIADLPDDMCVCDHEGYPPTMFVFDAKKEAELDGEPLSEELWEGENEPHLIITFH